MLPPARTSDMYRDTMALFFSMDTVTAPRRDGSAVWTWGRAVVTSIVGCRDATAVRSRDDLRPPHPCRADERRRPYQLLPRAGRRPVMRGLATVLATVTVLAACSAARPPLPPTHVVALPANEWGQFALEVYDSTGLVTGGRAVQAAGQ